VYRKADKKHTNQNQNYKAHRNGIKRMKKPKNMYQKGMDPKFIRNQKVAKWKQLALIKEGKA
jgi:large subunit ribosomal protein L29e